MSSHTAKMKETTMKALLVLTASWATAFVSMCALSLRPSEPFDFSVPIWMLITLIFQLALVIVASVAIARHKRKLVPALCLVLPLGAILYFFTIGYSQLEAWQYRIVKARQMEMIPLYEAVLNPEKLSPGVLDQSGYEYNVDNGPPRRIAFVQSGGLLDNYTAIVYDPTGLVMQANKFEDYSKWDDPKLRHVKKLFGGDLRWAEKLRGPWYLCGFT